MKLWSNNAKIDDIIEKFTIGQDPNLDMQLALYDLEGSAAHAKMLEKTGILNKSELSVILESLKSISKKVEIGDFEIEPGVEDIHSQVELLLTRELGDTGRKIHTGRSRNDQVLLDLRLMYRDRMGKLIRLGKELGYMFIDQSNTYKEALMPGYTHMQVAMVSSFGLWFASFAESLADDLSLIQSCLKIINKNPLGSVAGYGSSFPLDRELTTKLLGFDDLCVNSIYAQSSRGKTELIIANCIACMAYSLSRFACDVCLYSNQNHKFIVLPESVTTGSSIMPHKKNPDVFELIRGKCNFLQSVPGQVLMMCNNLNTGYHRDYQILKEIMFPALNIIENILNILIHSIPKIVVRKDILADKKYDHIYSVEAVNKLVQEGVPFRKAYQQVAESIKSGDFVPLKSIDHNHIGSIGNLGNDKIKKSLDDIKSD